MILCNFLRSVFLFLALWFSTVFAEHTNIDHVVNLPNRPSVLILSGLQKGYPVTDAVVSGAYEALREKGIAIPNIYIEYLDIPRSGSTGAIKYKLMELQSKLAKRNVAVIIAADYAALKAMTSSKHNLISPDVPVISALADDNSMLIGQQRPFVNLFPGFSVIHPPYD